MGDFASLGALRRLHFASLGRSPSSLTLYIDYVIIVPKFLFFSFFLFFPFSESRTKTVGSLDFTLKLCYNDQKNKWGFLFPFSGKTVPQKEKRVFYEVSAPVSQYRSIVVSLYRSSYRQPDGEPIPTRQARKPPLHQTEQHGLKNENQ